MVDVQSKGIKHELVPLNYDYMLVIDTEGLLSIQKSDDQYDKRLILFCLAISHLVIVNTEGEISDTVKKMLVLCAQSLKYLGETRITRPEVHFVLNKRSDPNKEYCQTLVEHVRESLKSNGLHDVIKLEQSNFHVLSMAFNRKPFSSSNGECAALVTDITFVANVQKICKLFVGLSSDILRETGDCFCVPTSWIEFADRVLQTIKKHPDLTHFQDAFERDQYNKIRSDIRKDFEELLSPQVARHLIEKEKENTSDGIKDSFKTERQRILGTLEQNLMEYVGKYAASENVRERLRQFIEVQLISIFRSWEVSAVMASNQYKFDRMVHDIGNELEQQAINVTHKNCFLDRKSAEDKFEIHWNSKYSEIESTFNSEEVWIQSIDVVSRLCDVFDKDMLPSGDNILAYLPFLKSLDRSAEELISIHDGLSKICTECISRASSLYPLNTNSTNMYQTISIHEIQKNYEFLNNKELSRIYLDLNKQETKTRESFRRGARQGYLQLFSNNWQTIVQISSSFEILIKSMEDIFTSKFSHEASTEITLVQSILGAVNKVIQDFDNELNVFNFCLSKQFRSALYICAVISTALFYSNRHRTHFRNALQRAREDKPKIKRRFIICVVIEENDDENVATNLVNELSEALCQSFVKKAEKLIEEQVQHERKNLNRCSIIKKLDDEVYKASDEWLKQYILYPRNMINERFQEKRAIIRAKIDKKIKTTLNFDLATLNEMFNVLHIVNTTLGMNGAHSLSFVDDLFEPTSTDNTSHPFGKKNCMARLFYQYLAGEPISTEMTTTNGSIYKVDSKWQQIIDKLPEPNEQLETIFRSIKNIFEKYTISYLGIFLDKVINQQNETEHAVRNQLTTFLDNTFGTIVDNQLTQLRGCQALCPCCKRLCDIDHHSEKTSLIGQGENKHRCQFGHQIRGMGGICYEITGEASISTCDRINDDDPIISDNHTRQTWKKFKNANADWEFDGPSQEASSLRYAYIWKRIGKELCQHYGNGMKFVLKNSPSPVNHFIFLLDHSGSMNMGDNFIRSIQSIFNRTSNITADSNETNLSPWKHLLKAVKEFIDIRVRQESLTDQITIIVFGNRAERIYNRRKLAEINIDYINMPMSTCGGGTDFSAAFKTVINTLEEIKSDSMRNRLRQTIIFMTDGEPNSFPTDELKQLYDYKKGS